MTPVTTSGPASIPPIWLISTIGTRDVQIDGKSPDPFGSGCEAAFHDENLRSKASFPILELVLKKLAYDSPGAKVSLTIIATKQNPPHENDTFPAAELIKSRFKELCHYAGLHFHSSPSFLTINENPQRYDTMMALLPRLLNKVHPEENARLAVNITGGTPALSFALALSAFERWGETVEVYHVNQYDNAAVKLNVPGNLAVMARRRQMKALAEKRQWLAVNHLAGEKALPDFPAAASLALCAQKLEVFDFDGALGALDDVFGFDQLGLGHLKKTICALRDDSPSGVRVRHLFFICARAWEDGDAFRFLATLFSGLDTLLGFFVAEQLNIGATKTGKEFPERLRERIFENPDLKNYLDRNNVRYDRDPSQYLYEKILEWLTRQEHTDSRANCLLDFIGRVKPLKDLRNESPVAHGFMGISLQLMRNALSRANALAFDPAEFNHLLDKIGLDPFDNPLIALERVLQEKI
ncbi:MAG TPA: hypothetical protein PLB62_09340 [Candidatus Sumerlaeota bacterium]|nr:hypothetical protein [Candidatus Sumerlaeota bacterium]